MNETDSSTKFRLKLSPKAPAIPCTISPAVYGPAYLTIYYHGRQDYIQLCGPASDLAAELRRLADIIEPSSVKERHKRQVLQDLAALPAALEKPETAWPWLVRRFPWLFDGVELSREPYASYLKSHQAGPDLAGLEALRGKVLSQADVAELLFGDRTKTGGSYRRRILAALDWLATTTPPAALDPDQEELRAA
jgi:hypothetical protein